MIILPHLKMAPTAADMCLNSPLIGVNIGCLNTRLPAAIHDSMNIKCNGPSNEVVFWIFIIRAIVTGMCPSP
jgi:hypothetical protein